MQKTLSLVPGGEQANYLLQRHVTKKLPANDAQFYLHFDESAGHIRTFEEHGSRPVQDARAYEFGAGWDLIGPLSLWMFGIPQQVLVDIDAHVRLELINHSIGQLARHHDALQERTGRSLRRVNTAPITSLDDLRERFDIDYRAPCDARDTGLDAGSFDLISNTFTLEHIPRESVADILVECARLLAPGGIVSSSIDMNDHYSFDDPSISPYNFLRYSDRRWRLINSSLHHQNRMRARDYLELFDAAGLEIVHESVRTPGAEGRAALQTLELAPRYARGYTLEELEPYAMTVVATTRS